MPLHVSSTMCSSSGGQNCTIQHLVSSHRVGGRPVHRLVILTGNINQCETYLVILTCNINRRETYLVILTGNINQCDIFGDSDR